MGVRDFFADDQHPDTRGIPLELLGAPDLLRDEKEM